jgi:hypothetical protein
MLEFVLLEDSVVNIKHGATGIAEDVLNALFSQATDEYLRAGEVFCTHYYFLSRSIGD